MIKTKAFEAPEGFDLQQMISQPVDDYVFKEEATVAESLGFYDTFDWSLVDTHSDLLRFDRGLLRFRQNSQLFHDRRYWFEPGRTDIVWHGVRLGQPDWGENSHSLAFELPHPTDQDHLYVILNVYWEPLEFELPQLSEGRRWARLVDTGLAPPQDFTNPVEALPDDTPTYLAQSRSAVVLTASDSEK